MSLCCFHLIQTFVFEKPSTSIFFHLHQTRSMSHIAWIITRFLGRLFQKRNSFWYFRSLTMLNSNPEDLDFFICISYTFWWGFSFATKVAQELWGFCHLILDMKWVSMNILIKNCSIWKTKFGKEKKGRISILKRAVLVEQVINVNITVALCTCMWFMVPCTLL